MNNELFLANFRYVDRSIDAIEMKGTSTFYQKSRKGTACSKTCQETGSRSTCTAHKCQDLAFHQRM